MEGRSVMPTRRSWPLNLVAGTALLLILLAVGYNAISFGASVAASTTAAQVTESAFDGYHAHFTTAGGTGCDVLIRVHPEQAVVGQRVTLRVAGWPRTCDHA